MAVANKGLIVWHWRRWSYRRRRTGTGLLGVDDVVLVRVPYSNKEYCIKYIAFEYFIRANMYFVIRSLACYAIPGEIMDRWGDEISQVRLYNYSGTLAGEVCNFYAIPQ